jgi:hypothetical protein
MAIKHKAISKEKVERKREKIPTHDQGKLEDGLAPGREDGLRVVEVGSQKDRTALGNAPAQRLRVPPGRRARTGVEDAAYREGGAGRPEGIEAPRLAARPRCRRFRQGPVQVGLCAQVGGIRGTRRYRRWRRCAPGAQGQLGAARGRGEAGRPWPVAPDDGARLLPGRLHERLQRKPALQRGDELPLLQSVGVQPRPVVVGEEEHTLQQQHRHQQQYQAPHPEPGATHATDAADEEARGQDAHAAPGPPEA